MTTFDLGARPLSLQGRMTTWYEIASGNMYHVDEREGECDVYWHLGARPLFIGRVQTRTEATAVIARHAKRFGRRK